MQRATTDAKMNGRLFVSGVFESNETIGEPTKAELASERRQLCVSRASPPAQY